MTSQSQTVRKYPDVVLDDMTCPVCGSSFSLHSDYLNREHPDSRLFDSQKMYVCPDCGLGASLPPLTTTDLKPFYQEEYRNADGQHANSGRQTTSKEPLSPRPLSQWLLMLTFKEFLPGYSYCDIGAGGDSMFHTARALGLELNAHAYEADLHIQNLLATQNVKVLGSTFGPETQLPEVKLDAISMSHVLEHFSSQDVLLVLEKVKSMLAPGGIFFCEVPHVPLNSMRHRISDAPHLTFWTCESMKRACEKVGFEVLFLSTAGELLSKKDLHNKTLSEYRTPAYLVLIKQFLPSSIQSFLIKLRTWLVEIKQRVKSFLRGSPASAIWTKPVFKYGPDRLFLRIICRG